MMIASDVSGVVIPIVKLMLQAKCQGKEHMIESEIAILSSVEHPHIIQLKEQQLDPWQDCRYYSENKIINRLN